MKMLRDWSRTNFWALGVLAAIALPACAQTEDDVVSSMTEGLTQPITVQGVVRDPSGRNVAGVTVTLSGKVWRTLTTDANGRYAFTGLSSGSYSLRASRNGCTFSPDNVNLNNLQKSVEQQFEAFGAACQGTSAPTFHKKVMAVIHDPMVPAAGGGTVRLSASMGWSNPHDLIEQYKNWFTTTTNGRVSFDVTIVAERDEYPAKVDGFRYTSESYLACWNDRSLCHMPDNVDYNQLLAAEGGCEKVNAGLIDEIWVFGAPYFGYWESTLAGPNAYWYNSSPVTGTTCQKLLPIMGFSYERGLAEMIEDFHHRTESTMSRVYGGWQENRMDHNWDKFALVAAQSPSFGYSGCGSAHYPPNATQDYQWDNASVAQTFCDDFLGYPNLHEPSSVLRPITCAEWGCNQVGYQTWWYRHVPAADGVGPDGKFNDWWKYLVDPNAVFLTD
jgi:hypothetical protein